MVCADLLFYFLILFSCSDLPCLLLSGRGTCSGCSVCFGSSVAAGIRGLSRGSPGILGWVAAGSRGLGPFQVHSDRLALRQAVLTQAMPSGDLHGLSPLKPLAAMCSRAETLSLSKESSKDYTNPFSGDKCNSWKSPLHLFRNNNIFHTSGSVFIGHFSWHQTPLCPKGASSRLLGIRGAGSKGRQGVRFLLPPAV